MQVELEQEVILTTYNKCLVYLIHDEVVLHKICLKKLNVTLFYYSSIVVVGTTTSLVVVFPLLQLLHGCVWQSFCAERPFLGYF